MRKLLIVGTLLLVSCVGCSPEKAIVERSPAASPASILKCQLPVFLSNGFYGDVTHGPNGAGFVGFPGGGFTDDHTGNISPYYGHTYDWAVHRWLPVGPDAVAPDGLSYLNPNDETGQLDLVDARNDSHRALVTGVRNALSYQPEGIYLNKDYGGQSHGSPGLWRLDPSTGAIRQITSQGPWANIGAGAAWGFDGYGDGSLGATLRRLDLKSGDLTTWYASAPMSYLIFGHDQVGRPLLENVLFDTGAGEFFPVDLYELSAPGQVVKIITTSAGVLPSVPMSDEHGIWIAAGTVIWLYSRGSLAEMANLPGSSAQPAGSAWVQVTGRCASPA